MATFSNRWTNVVVVCLKTCLRAALYCIKASRKYCFFIHLKKVFRTLKKESKKEELDSFCDCETFRLRF
jgi:hypothetical protein